MKNLRLITEAWKVSPSLWKTRRQAIALVFCNLLATLGAEEAIARAIHGGIAVPTGGSETTLVAWTVTEKSGSAQSNVPIEVPMVFSEAGGYAPFSSTDAIVLYDSDGVTQIPVQECNRFSDRNGPDIRGCKLVAILPTLNASQARQLTIKKASLTTVPSGTDISVADILATGFTCPATMDLDDGVTYTADLATGLSAGTWTNKTTAANQGTWLTGGGLATSYVVFCPFKNGGSATPDNLGFWGEVTAYKAGRGAVSVSNPIIGIRVQYWVKLGYAQASVATVTNHWYDLSVTCGANTQSWVGSTPSTSLTLSSASAEATITVTAGASVFTANSIGNVIDDGTGACRIQAYTSPTVVQAQIGNAMSGVSISSGNWRIYGLNHQYAAGLPPQEIWYSGSPAITAQPNLDSSLGVAWTGSSGGPFSYFKNCKMILPYSTPYTSVTNSMTLLNANGTNPTGMGSTYAGDITLYQPQTGGRDDIAPLPGWEVGALIKWDSNAKLRIMGNSKKIALFPMYWLNENTGKSPLFNNGTNYVQDSSWSGTRIALATSYQTGGREYQISDATAQIAHHPGMNYTASLLTGDFYWVEQLHEQIFWLWSGNNPTYWGSQLNRLFCCSSEQRGNGWSFRDLAWAILLTPDRNPSCLSYTRSHLITAFDNQFTATNSGTPGVNPSPGLNITTVNNTGSGKTYATSGVRDMYSGLGAVISPWQGGYVMLAFFQMQYQGMVTADAATWMTWFMEGITGASTHPDVVANWLVPNYRYIIDFPYPAATNYNSWTDVYRATANSPLNGANSRIVTGTGITLSALSGSITVTMPAGYFTTGGSFYVDGMVKDLNAASLQILPIVNAAGSGYAVNDIISLTISNDAANFTITTRAQLRVTGVNGSGGVTSVSIETNGLYIAKTTGSYDNTGSTCTQFSTTGAGTGATFNTTGATPESNTPPIRFGVAKITGVSGDVVTMTTSGSFSGDLASNIYCYPFAQTGLTTNKIQVPAPAPGDSNGGTVSSFNQFMPQPYTSYYEYWDINQQCVFMADAWGYTDGAAAKAAVNAAYTGGNALKWKVS